MSEKKRFEWIDKDTISDNQTDEWYCFLFDDIRDDFVDLLNGLHEENEKLNSEMKINLKEFSRLFKQNFAQKRKINDLQAENIQLRQEIKRLEKSDLND